jgi:vitamin B12 transporter
MTWVIGVLSLAFLLCSWDGVAAQEPAPPMEPVVVTATKTETPVGQTGSSVSVITREQIEQRQTTEMLQILRDQPGFTLIQTGIRGGTTGISARGGNTNMNLVLIDGMKVNAGGGGFDFANTTSAGIGRVEIVRGPQSALYGADAMTSVIQFFTPRGEGPFAAWGFVGGGNWGTNTERVGASWGNQQAGVFLEYVHAGTQGILNVNSEHQNNTVAGRLDFSPIKDLDFTFTARYIQSRVGIPTEGTGDRFEMLDPHQSQEDERFVGTFGTRYRQTSWLEHRLKFGANYAGSVFADPFDADVPTDAFSPPEGTKTTSTETRLLLDYSLALTPPKVWEITPVAVLGGAYEYEHFKQRLHPPGTPERTHVSRDTKSVYGQLQLGWRDSIFVTAGARYDDSTAYGTEVTPRVSAAVVAPWTKTRLRGAWGTGIKEPSFFEEFGGFGIPGNPDLQAERSQSWEVGIDQPLFGQLVEIGATYFENRFKDQIAFISFTEGSTNIQAAKTSGVEAVVQLRPWKGLTATGTYMYLQTEVTDDGGIGGQNEFPQGEPLLRRPKHSGSVSIGYTYDRIRAAATLYVKGQSIDRDFHSPGAPRVTLPGYEKLDLALAVVLFRNLVGLQEEISWNINMQNVLNQKYEEVFGFSSPRFSFLTGLAARF